MRINLLKQLLKIHSPSRMEQGMVAFLADYAREHGYRFETDLWNNTYLRKGKTGPVPAVCAHIDTVPTVGTGKLRQQRGRLFGMDGQGQLVGIGGDDKAGVYVCLELLERLDNLAVMLFAAEEIGGLGSKNAPAAWFTDVGYLIEFDCPGQGLVSYTSGGVRLFPNDGDFIQRAAPVMAKHKLTQWQYHPFSDVMVVRQRFPISCLNLSCGYYNWHQPDEYIVLAEVSAAIRSGHALIKALGCKRYDFPVGGMDNVPPRFEVTSLKVPPPVSRAVKPVKPLPMALKPTATELAPTIMPGLDEDESMLDYVIPDDVSFFKLALLDRLKSRAYHTFSLLGPFKMPQLCEAFREHIFRSDTMRAENGHKLVTRLLFTFADNVYGYLEDDRLKVYGPSPEVALATAERFTGFIKPKAEEKPYFCIMSLEDTGPSAQKVTIHRPAPVTTEDLALNYGDDFPAWEDGWLQRMNQSGSGLSILLGPPGCGKTSYLRALMTRLLNKAIFYFVPVDSMDLLTSPRYVNFWVKQTERHSKMRKIAILEDAEELLLPREGHTRDRVSNLLNIADGFLGDHLKLHVLATTNVAMDQLDPAIIRPGRLTGSREFRRLQRPEALRLAEAKGLCLPEGQPDYSLAEIYCGRPASTLGDCKRQIGFAS